MFLSYDGCFQDKVLRAFCKKNLWENQVKIPKNCQIDFNEIFNCYYAHNIEFVFCKILTRKTIENRYFLGHPTFFIFISYHT